MRKSVPVFRTCYSKGVRHRHSRAGRGVGSFIVKTGNFSGALKGGCHLGKLRAANWKQGTLCDWGGEGMELSLVGLTLETGQKLGDCQLLTKCLVIWAQLSQK